MLNGDRNVTLLVEMAYPVKFDIEPVYIYGVEVQGFENEDSPCPSDEGVNPVSYEPFNKHVTWDNLCESVCTLPCGDDSTDLECYENTCAGEFMACNYEYYKTLAYLERLHLNSKITLANAFAERRGEFL